MSEDCYFVSCVELCNCLVVLLGGCVVEVLVMGEVFIGVVDDFVKVIDIVYDMVVCYGMLVEVG